MKTFDFSPLFAIFPHVFSGSIAQLVEQRPLKAMVGGSSPPRSTSDNIRKILFCRIFYFFSELYEGRYDFLSICMIEGNIPIL